MIESPNDHIEDGVKPLCDALNSHKGIQTHFSCEGHPERNKYRGYVSFTAENDEGFAEVLKKMPQCKRTSWFVNDKEHSIWCRIEAGILQGEISYSVRFGGRPACCLRLIREQVAQILNEERRFIRTETIDKYRKNNGE